jgi:TonB family protein
MSKHHPPAYWLALVLLLLPTASSGDSLQSTLALGSELHLQEKAQSLPNKATAEALTEASQLTHTVVIFFKQERYEEALPLAKRALELREAVLAADSVPVQSALLNLAEVYTAMKKFGEAQSLIERLARIHEAKVGGEDAELALVLDRLAYVAFMRRDFSKTEAAHKRALAIREKVFGPDSVEFAASLFSLAEIYRYRWKLDKAQPLYEQAAILQAKLLGTKHPEFQKTSKRFTCTVYESEDANYLDTLKAFSKKLNLISNVAEPNPLSGGVLNGKAISLPKPWYPTAARSEHAQGVVVIQVEIDETGKVIGAEDFCGGHPLLVKPSLEAARGARFTPTKLSGQPVRVHGMITYRFIAQ